MSLKVVGNNDGTVTISCGDSTVTISVADYAQGVGGGQPPIVWPPRDVGGPGLGTCLRIRIGEPMAREFNPRDQGVLLHDDQFMVSLDPLNRSQTEGLPDQTLPNPGFKQAD